MLHVVGANGLGHKLAAEATSLEAKATRTIAESLGLVSVLGEFVCQVAHHVQKRKLEQLRLYFDILWNLTMIRMEMSIEAESG